MMPIEYIQTLHPISGKTNKKIIFLLLFAATSCLGQKAQVIEKVATKFSIEQKNDTIDFIVVDTLLGEQKPVFLWCQGSLPMPLFGETKDYKIIFFGGGIANFNYKAIAKKYHLVVISMPKTPVLAKKEHLNGSFQYVPNLQMPHEFSNDYIKADYLENYVDRAQQVLGFLKKQPWVDSGKLVVAGHSQGSKVAAKIAVDNKGVTHLGLFAANPFGRIDQFIRESRLDAQLGKTTWEHADSLMQEQYEFYKQVHSPDAIRENPSLISWKSFSESFLDDWLSLDIPIYLTYGTEDRTADLCDLVPLFFTEKNNTNLTMKRHLRLEHNFFEVLENGQRDYNKSHWPKVMEAFINWIK